MKKNNLFKYFVITSMVVMTTSCSKDFLEVDPYGKSDASTYYSTDGEVKMALTAAYDMLHSDQLFGWSSPFFIMQLPGDDTNCGGGGESDQAQYQAIDDFKWDNENSGIRALYSIDYHGIFRCNQLINNVKPGGAERTRMVAEAKFLRAYFFLQLTTAYGEVPLRITAAATLTEGIAKSPQAQIYAQIIKDLNEAIVDLPNKGEYAAADKNRANKQAAQALLGKTYLYAKDYPKAIDAFKLVIARDVPGSDVGLLAISDLPNFTKKEFEYCKESLFEATFVSENKNWGNANWDRNADDNRHLQLSGPRDFEGGTSGINGGWGFNPPTPKLYNAFEVGDTRRAMTVISSKELADLYNGKFTALGWDMETITGGYTLIRTKYQTYASETIGDPATPELNFSTNWRLIRYSDVLLMAAEAYHFNGQSTEALVELNKVRTRANLLPVLAGANVFDAIVHERQVELAYEGVRFWDLVRWGLADQELKSLGFVKGKHEHFPIPLDEMNGNSMFGAQNPGY